METWLKNWLQTNCGKQLNHSYLPSHQSPRAEDRASTIGQLFSGIVFVLKSGIPWEMLPQEMGCGSGMTCWRRLKEWQEAGVWERLHRVLLDRLGEADQIEWEGAAGLSG
jgi:transposase